MTARPRKTPATVDPHAQPDPHVQALKALYPQDLVPCGTLTHLDPQLAPVGDVRLAELASLPRTVLSLK